MYKLLVTYLLVVLMASITGCSDEQDDNSCCGENLDTCEDISESYRGYVERNATCSLSTDCYLFTGFCEKGLGNCYEAVSAGTQTVIDVYGDRWIEMNCTTEIDLEQCDCAIVPTIECSPEKRCRIVPDE